MDKQFWFYSDGIDPCLLAGLMNQEPVKSIECWLLFAAIRYKDSWQGCRQRAGTDWLAAKQPMGGQWDPCAGMGDGGRIAGPKRSGGSNTFSDSTLGWEAVEGRDGARDRGVWCSERRARSAGGEAAGSVARVSVSRGEASGPWPARAGSPRGSESSEGDPVELRKAAEF